MALGTVGARPDTLDPRRHAGARPDLDSSIGRPARLETLDGALRTRLTTVVAGPGWGKTHLLTSWSPGRPCVWYRPASGRTAMPAVGLVEALRARLPALPDFGGWCGPEWADGTDVEAVAAAVAAELGRVCDTDIVLVVDDVQDLGADAPAIELLEALCRHAPPLLHLVLSSRTRLPFPVERLRGRGEVLELDDAVLGFDVSETRALLARVLGRRELDTLPEQVRAITHGWPAATRLAAEWLRCREPEEWATALTVLHRPGGPLFGYLAEEVLPAGDPLLHALLSIVAPLPRFDVELCRALGVDVEGIGLARLARGELFVRQQPDDPGWFTLGPLIREFALACIPRDVQGQVLRSAMSWFIDNRLLADALRCAVALDEPARTADLLGDHGQDLLAQGTVAELLAASSSLPKAVRSDAVEWVEGQARLVHGDWRGAMVCLRRAARDHTELTPALAWRLCWVHYVRGELDEAIAVFDRSRPGAGTTADEAVLLSVAASAIRRHGGIARSRSLADRAMAAATASEDDHALAAAHTCWLLIDSRDGDRAGTEAHATAGLAAARRAGDALRVISILAHRGGDRIEQGDYGEALGELETAVSRAEQVGDMFGLAVGLRYRGMAQLGLGRLDEAIVDLEAARLAYQRIESHDVAFALLGLADVYRERGDLALARSAYTEAVRRGERSGDSSVMAPALAGLARVLVGEDPQAAAAAVERALGCGRDGGRVCALLAAGWLMLDRGLAAQADVLAGAAIEAAGARRDRPGLAEALELRAAASPDPTGQLSFMGEAAEIWAGVGNPIASARNAVARARMAGDSKSDRAECEERLRALGVHDHAAPAAGLLAAVSSGWCTDVEIRTLGGFDVLRAGRPVRATEWSSKKARDLLKLLITRRGRPTPREVLIETLWPAEDPARCANRLSVALSTVRAVLDPGHRHAPGHFVHADKYVVGLTNLRVDVEQFLTAAARVTSRPPADQVLDELRAVEARYTGDFLEEDPYEDWTVSLREQARAAYLGVARALAHAAASSGDEDLAEWFHLRVLERDAYDEQAHLGLTEVLVAAGRHGQARARYRTYTRCMAELGIEPAPFPDLKSTHRYRGTVSAWRRS